MIKLLFVEDSEALAYAVQGGLELIEDDEYDIRHALNGKEAFEIFKTFAPDVVVSDIEMPVMNGIELARAIREIDDNVPIILASGLTSPQTVCEGFSIEIDAYIKKPYIAQELHPQIKAILRRVQRSIAPNPQKDSASQQPASDKIKIGKYTFDPERGILSLNNKTEQKLTSREADILFLLYENRHSSVKRSDILERFWKDDDPAFSSRSLDVFITKLRKYLSEDERVKIVNERGKGLWLEVG
ncbi:MAG: response regulator transcription factor [Dysgonamonadaceae bacterium]|jgi:DNA-binding response OmpR family regulator|nr:response regulator transcription factor [Dysgonamonadaceae bacterium]